jgi:GNAT superfamily N-acetyltransferase
MAVYSADASPQTVERVVLMPVGDRYEISHDRGRLDLDMIHGFLSRAYWSPDVPRHVVEKAVDHSVCAGAYREDKQVGFARAVTDYATFAYLADVFVLEEHRGRGVAKAMVQSLLLHPELKGLRTWLLLTRDAHGLYAKLGFSGLDNPGRAMIVQNREIYRRGS